MTSEVTQAEIRPAEARQLNAELLDALREAHRALMHYEWYNNPASGWAAAENETLRSKVDAAIGKAVE